MPRPRVPDWVGPAWGRARIVLAVITPLGWGVLATGVVAWVLGVRLGWQEALVIGFACLVAMVLATVFTLGRALVRVDVGLHPERVIVGNPAAGQVTVTNTARRRLFPIRLELVVGLATAMFDLPSLGSDQSHEELFVVPTHRRAVIEVGPATTVRGDPLGLLRNSVEWAGVKELFVHPRISLLESLGAGFLRDLEGNTTNDISMSDLAFHTLRDYEPGDDRRYVHWRSTARTGRLLVRQFVDTRRSHVTVVVDGTKASYRTEDDFETAISVAGSLSVRALRDEQDTTMLASDRTIAGRTPRLLLDDLARVAPMDRPLSEHAAHAWRLAADTSIAVLVTGALMPFTDLRRAAAIFPPSVRTLAMVINGAGSTGISDAGQLTVLTIPTLDDLPGVMRAVLAR